MTSELWVKRYPANEVRSPSDLRSDVRRPCPWVRKYTPKKLSEIIGQTKAVKQFAAFINTFPRSKAVLFAGSPGIGKTSVVKAFANQFNFEVVELNASDKRNKASINDIIMPACTQASIFGRRKIIVLDEIDGLSGMKDRGGAPTLLKAIDASKFPLILTANDAYSKKLRAIRKKVTLINFERVNYLSLAKHLCGICDKEGVKYDPVAVQNIAASSNGDVRAAINDLQTLASSGAITCGRILESQRNREESIFELLKIIFKSNDAGAVFDAVDSISEDYGVLAYWLDHNIHKEYHGPALKRGYDCISRADIFNRRIMRQQHWRFLAYIHDLVSAGVQQAKQSKVASTEWASYRPPGLMLKLWHRKARRAKRKAEMERAGELLHASSYRLERAFLPYYDAICTRDKKAGAEIKEWLNK